MKVYIKHLKPYNTILCTHTDPAGKCSFCEGIDIKNIKIIVTELVDDAQNQLQNKAKVFINAYPERSLPNFMWKGKKEK